MLGRGEILGREARSLFDRLLRLAGTSVLAVAIGMVAMDHGSARTEERVLKLYNVHTKERATIVFKRGGRYDSAGLNQVNQFLRDWRRNEPTKMDPQLMDLLWEAYRQTGSSEYINVISSYRSPATNGDLRRRSKGVAENSLHMQGKAIDFFIPGVELSKLRAIGLKMQAGGVGFYPTSGSPFVHLDTGSVRHWPRMSRQQLVAVFPNGGTIHVPSDGKPLPGYDQAMASYKSRKASGAVAIADASPPPKPTVRPTGEPIVLAVVDFDESEDDIAAATAPQAAIAAVMAPPPLPRLAPRRVDQAGLNALLAAVPEEPAAQPAPAAIEIAEAAAMDAADATPLLAYAAADAGLLAPSFDFGGPQDWAAPAVPSDLARAMAERDRVRRSASLPIAPTAVVATIDMSRPLRAAAMTTAVLRDGRVPEADMPHVLAYAPVDEPVVARPQARTMTADGVPMPVLSPRHTLAPPRIAATTSRSVVPPKLMPAPELTMTALDTQSLRLWIGPASTRQRVYAIFTMPEFARASDLMAKPLVSFGAGFGQSAYLGLRTDSFTGPLVVQPEMVDLGIGPIVASVR